MQFFKRLWQDIVRGENIDLYIAVIIALGLAVLNLLGIAPPSTLAPITLAVLGLLAISTLGSRHQVEKLLEKLSQTADSFFLEEHPQGYKEDVLASAELWFIGVSLDRTIRNNHSVLERKLQKGDSIKVLLVHPEGAASEIAASRMQFKTEADAVRQLIHSSLNYLSQLKQVAPSKLEIRTIQDPLTFGGVVINPNSASGVLYLAHHPHKNTGRSHPKFVLRARDGYWYDFFKLEIQTLWEAGVEWKEHSQTLANNPGAAN